MDSLMADERIPPDGPMARRSWSLSTTRLGPTLTTGDLVIMDDLRAHKVKGVREAIEATGPSLLSLPPCSPDLNPIDMMAAKLKAMLQKAAGRTVDRVWQGIGKFLDQFSANEWINDLKKAGYEPT